MDVDALELAADFCRAGGTVVAAGRLPDRDPGLGRERGSQRVKALVREIFGENLEAGKPHPCGHGRGVFVPSDSQAAEALAPFVAPSVTMTPRPETVGFVHRRYAGRDIFFFVNVGPDPVSFEAEFHGPQKQFEFWDALSGRIRTAGATGSKVALNLPARGSMFVVAGNQTSDAEPEDVVEKGATVERTKLDLVWSLSFAGPDAPSPVKLQTLKSWTELPDGKFFSGTGTYEASLSWSGSESDRCALRFEQVHEAAEVLVNGKSVGMIFAPPYVVDLTSALKQGANDLEVTVGNLPLNRFLGLPDQDLGPLRAKYGTRFEAPEDKKISSGPAASGLIGGVWLEISRRKE